MKTLWILLLIFFIHSSHSALECTKSDNCKCYASPGEYEFQCPKYDYFGLDTDNIEILIHAKEGEKFQIDCLSTALKDTLLPNITVSEVEYFFIRSCPLPEPNFKHTLDRVGAKVTYLFHFASANLSDITLTKKYFIGFEDLENLKLNSNDLVDVEEDVFANTPNLKALHLEDNRLKLKKDLFKYTPLLTFLDLSQNELTEIPAGIFRFLGKLLKLHLWGNFLTKLDEPTFEGVSSLKSLELSSNRIENISDKTFNNLRDLQQISLSFNAIKFLPRKLFAHNLKLVLIRLMRNKVKLVLPEEFFANLSLLKEIDLSSTKIESLPYNTFQNSSNLTKIILTDTGLRDLPLNVFAGLTNLEEINLRENRIVNISYIFSSLKKLKKLNLAKNSIEEIGPNALSDLFDLEEIDLSKNKITFIYSFAFAAKNNLKIIDLSHNLYESKHLLSPLFESVVSAVDINLSDNLITTISDVIVMYNKVKIKSLDLSSNRIKQLNMYDLFSTSNNKVHINLEKNNISSVAFDGMRSIVALNNLHARSINSKAPISEVYLNDNPVICDCLNFDFVEYFSMYSNDPGFKVVFDLRADNLSCAGPPELKDLSVDHLDSSLLKCTLEQIAKENSGCPENCSCAWRPHDKSILVDCANQNLNQFPELNFNLSSKYPFNQIELRLEGNKLVTGPSSNLTGYENVTKLYLSNNNITNISWIPNRIEILALNNNSLTHLDDSFLERLNATNFSRLVLSNNSWDCSCDATNFTVFLQHNLLRIDTQNIFCSNTQKRLVSMSESNLCHKWQLVYTVLLVTAVLLLAAILIAVYYRYRDIIDSWLYFHGCCRGIIGKKEDQSKTYDVFLSYSHKDEKFVTETLLAVLESGPNPFKICVHWRDFEPGEFIVTGVTKSVLDSRRTLVVLSPNYLESVWGKMEFRTAHSQAMLEGKARVILILYGDIDVKKLDPELKLYMNTNTYIKWGDPNFWSRLIKALPHQDKYVRHKQKHANVMNFIDEKFNFVNGSPVTGSPGTTPPIVTLDVNNLKSHPLNFVPSSEIQTPPAESGALLTTVTT